MIRTIKDIIDKDGKIIIKELEKNSKVRIDKIAEKCGFSRRKVWKIIRRFERERIIWGYHAVVDKEKLKIKQYIILIKREAKPPNDTINKIINFTVNTNKQEIGVDIHCSSYIHGYYDWMFVFTANDLRHAKKFSELLLKEFKYMVSEIHLMEDILSVKKCGIINPNLQNNRESV